MVYMLKWLNKWATTEMQHQPRALRRFSTGVMIFTLGVVGLLLTESLIRPSLEQEIAALLALVVAGIGIARASLGYAGMSIARILYYLLNKE